MLSKRTLLLVALAIQIGLVRPGFAQTVESGPSPVFAPTGEQGRELRTVYQEGRSFRAAGMILTLMGSALVLIGVPLYVADPGNEGFPARTLGAITFSGGGVAIVSGISVWIYGSHRMREAENQGYRAWLPFVAPTSGGAVAGISIPTF